MPSIYDQASDNLAGAGGAYGDAASMYGNPGLMGMAGPGRIASGISGYMNPYTSQVINRSIMDMSRLTDMQQNENAAGAEAAGAFGGSRHGLVEAETNSAAQRNLGDLAAGLRSTGFNTAAQLSGQDINNRMGWNIAKSGDELSRAGGMVGAGGALQGLGGLQFGMGQQIGQQQQQAGSLQQALQQALMGGAQSQYGQFMAGPQNLLQMMISSLSGNPMTQTGTTTQTHTPGLFDWASLAAQGVGSYFGMK